MSVSRWVCVGMLASACGSAAPPPARPPAPPPPARPVVAAVPAAPVDCAAAADEGPTLEFAMRSIPEAVRLAQTGHDELMLTLMPEYGPKEREDYLRQAAKDLLAALEADPYNVAATFDLASLYGRVGAAQCRVNLVVRIAQLDRLPSHHDEAAQKIDRILGRSKQAASPDFDGLPASIVASLSQGAIPQREDLGGATGSAIAIKLPGELATIPTLDDTPVKKVAKPTYVTLDVAEMKGAGTGSVIVLKRKGAALAKGAQGYLVANGKAIARSQLTVTAVKNAEYDAVCSLSVKDVQGATGAVFEVVAP